MPEFPPKLVRYDGPMINNDIWASFQLRPDDVLVVTPPKCGTTWTQIIVTSILAARPLSSAENDEVSRWLDPGFRERVELARFFDAQDFRRCIKTHTPLDGILYDPSATYLGVYRHPIDAYFSMGKHQENMTLDMVRDRFPEDIGEGFRMFLEDELWGGACDAMDLHSIVHHYRSLLRMRHLPNIHLMHYADLTRDPAGQIARIAGILGIALDPATLAEIAKGTGFGTIKRKAKEAAASAEPNPIWRDPSAFFDSGTSKKWVGRLDDAQLEAFDKRLAVLLPDDAAREWLLWGDAGSPRFA